MHRLFFLILCPVLFMSFNCFANNGEFIVSGHSWYEGSSAVVPIYFNETSFDEFLKSTNKLPQANCTGVLINEGQNLLSAAHCFQELCPTKKDKKASDYFIYLNGKKFFLEGVDIHPDYCYLAFELPQKERITPNPAFPELLHDISVSKMKKQDIQSLQNEIPFFPIAKFMDELNTSPLLSTVGYGVSDRYLISNTLWMDDDHDNVHDFWDLCPLTAEELIKKDNRLNPENLYSTNGCSASQQPLGDPIAMDYYASTKISHKRGYSFAPFLDGSLIFEKYRISEAPFIVNKGYRGALHPYNHLQAMSFGADSGAPVFADDKLEDIVAITVFYAGIQDYAIEQIKQSKKKDLDTRTLMNSGFNVYLKLSENQKFLESVLGRQD